MSPNASKNLTWASETSFIPSAQRYKRVAVGVAEKGSPRRPIFRVVYRGQYRAPHRTDARNAILPINNAIDPNQNKALVAVGNAAAGVEDDLAHVCFFCGPLCGQDIWLTVGS